jgi:predicted hotdog family 3-hydroxylacyl-ACP dehydratase
MLPAVSGIEYAAQAIALHLALTQSDGHVLGKGYLAAVQSCAIHKQDLDHIDGSLDINCSQIYLDPKSGALYEFTLSAQQKQVLTGRLLIMFKSDHI